MRRTRDAAATALFSRKAASRQAEYRDDHGPVSAKKIIRTRAACSPGGIVSWRLDSGSSGSRAITEYQQLITWWRIACQQVDPCIAPVSVVSSDRADSGVSVVVPRDAAEDLPLAGEEEYSDNFDRRRTVTEPFDRSSRNLNGKPDIAKARFISRSTDRRPGVDQVGGRVAADHDSLVDRSLPRLLRRSDVAGSRFL